VVILGGLGLALLGAGLLVATYRRRPRQPIPHSPPPG